MFPVCGKYLCFFGMPVYFVCINIAIVVTNQNDTDIYGSLLGPFCHSS